MEENVNPLGTEKIGKLLAGFAIPSIIAMLVSSLYNVVDQIFIGQGVGKVGNAATNISFPLTTICMAIMLMIGIGSSTQFSLNLGKGDAEESSRVVGHGVCMMITFGVAYALFASLFLEKLLIAFGAEEESLPYAMEYARIIVIGMPFLITMNGLSNLARADGSPKYSMITMIVGAVINTILDPIFIFVFDMGMTGAALATVIGQVCSFLMAFRYLWKFKRVKIRLEYFRLSLKRMGRTAVMGMSNGLTQIAFALVQVVMNNSLTKYGALSKYGAVTPVAAAGIVMKVNSLILAVIIGINQGSQPILGYNYGAAKYDRVKKTYALEIKVALLFALSGLAVLQLFPRAILSLFGKGDDLYMEFAVRFLRIFPVMLPLNGVQMLSSNFFAAIGKPHKGTLLSLTRQVMFLIPLIFIMGNLFGLEGILFSAPIADFTAFLVVVIMIAIEMKNIGKLQAAQAEGTVHTEQG